jgi:hypothetical protein
MWGCFAFFFVDGRRLLVGGRFTSWGLVKTRGQQQTKRAGRTSSEMSTEGEMRCCCWWRCASSVCLALRRDRRCHPKHRAHAPCGHCQSPIQSPRLSPIWPLGGPTPTSLEIAYHTTICDLETTHPHLNATSAHHHLASPRLTCSPHETGKSPRHGNGRLCCYLS